jgi:hypothetical protein
MNKVLSTPDRTLLSFTNEEFTAVMNAVNEVCNGVHIEDWEFQTRIGVTREFLRSVLRDLNLDPLPARQVPELLQAWEDGGVMVRAISVYGDPLKLGVAEAQAFAEKLKTAIREAN